MFELKRLSDEAIPAALEKALRYRLLNEPAEAESICHDVLQIDPDRIPRRFQFRRNQPIARVYCPYYR
jgi:hypothetical protein